MAFDPISWMVSFSLNRGATRILTKSQDAELAKKLRLVIHNWVKENSDRFTVNPATLETLFQAQYDKPDSDGFTARRRLSETVLDHKVPSRDELRDALVERWHELRHGRNLEEMTDFFQLRPEDATSELTDLAARMRTVLQEDPRLFQVTVAALVEALDHKVDELLARVDSQREELQEKLDEEKRRSHQLARGVAGAIGHVMTVLRYEPHPEISRLANNLTNLLAKFDAEFRPEQLSENDDLRIRLAKATVANAEQHYASTLGLVSEEEELTEHRTAKEKVNRALQASKVRGDAFYGQREWRQALACYKRILALQHNHWDTRGSAANCLLNLGQLHEALEHYVALVKYSTRLVEDEGRTELANDLASSHNNRGNALHGQGKLDDAIRDFQKAIEIYTRLVEQEGRAELANDLATVQQNLQLARQKLDGG